MEVFKLAFETTIVGLLTFVWLGVATYFLFPDFVRDLPGRIHSDVVNNYKAAIGVGIFTLAYCLGSAILPIAEQLVNDEHWPLNEDGLRCQVFVRQKTDMEHAAAFPEDKDYSPKETLPDHCSHWAPLFAKKLGIAERMSQFRHLAAPYPNEGIENDIKVREMILTPFLRQEATVLNQASDNTELLKQLRERIVVLRGSVFSGFVLLLICLSAYFAPINGGVSRTHWIRPLCGRTLAVIFLAFAVLNGYQDLKKRDIFDIPVLESMLIVIIIFGVVVVWRGVETPLFRTKRYALIALFFTFLTYGGWMWSEILYDQQVINSFAVLQKDGETQKPALGR
jgi:hypothetical protein